MRPEAGRLQSAALRKRLLRNAVYIVGALPALWTYHLAISDQLGADPVKVLERTLGLWALRFLLIGLAIRPLQVHLGVNLMSYRRAVGLLAFGYAVLHVIVYIWLDQGLDVAAIVRDMLRRPYITIGMAALLILVPLAVTSCSLMIRRLGGKAWAALHRWVYLAAALGVLHFMLLLKTWAPEPLVYGGLLAGLLLWRVWDRRAGKARRRAARSATAQST